MYVSAGKQDVVSTAIFLVQLFMYLNPNVEEDLPRAQKESHVPDIVISGHLEKKSLKVPVVQSFWVWALASEELKGHHDLFLQNS